MTPIKVHKDEYNRWQQHRNKRYQNTGPGGHISYLKRIKFLEEYDKCGVVSTAAKEAGISYATAYRIVKKRREAGE